VILPAFTTIFYLAKSHFKTLLKANVLNCKIYTHKPIRPISYLNFTIGAVQEVLYVSKTSIIPMPCLKTSPTLKSSSVTMDGYDLTKINSNPCSKF
jgi:hypothetical protein